MLSAVALDHYFSHDLDALEATNRLRIRRLPFERFRRKALRLLGESAGSGLSGFNAPALEPAREAYGRWLAQEVRSLYREWPFDVVILPSDIFFYVRAMPSAAHGLGVPVVVVQKETTISPDTLEHHSRVVRAEAPFISDYMTVCSARQREFWIRAGAAEASVEVTGQPRFDLYAAPMPEVTEQRVLFLSYELDAYEPGVAGGLGRPTWKALRDETEAVLFSLARSGAIRLTVKLHPQQSRAGELERLAAKAGEEWNHAVAVADPEADTRLLIKEAAAVVGFQTTGLYESVAAQKTTVYAAWGISYEKHRSALIPFDMAQGCVHHARSTDELKQIVLRGRPAKTNCRVWVEDALGPLDGGAAARVVDAIERVSQGWVRTPAARHSRASTAAWLLRTALSEGALTLGMPVAALANKRRGVEERARRARTERQHAQAAIRGW